MSKIIFTLFVLIGFGCTSYSETKCYLDDSICMSSVRYNNVDYYSFQGFPNEDDFGFILAVSEIKGNLYVTIQQPKNKSICKSYRGDNIQNLNLQSTDFKKILYQYIDTNKNMNIFKKVMNNTSKYSEINAWFSGLEINTKYKVSCSNGVMM